MSGRRERGATLWSVLFCLLVAGFIVYLAFKIAPPYFNNWQVEHALASVAKSPDAAAMGRSQLRNAVRRVFSVGYVSRVSVAKDLRIPRTAQGRRVLVFSYNVRVPIAYNVTALLHFVDRRVVGGP